MIRYGGDCVRRNLERARASSPEIAKKGVYGRGEGLGDTWTEEVVEEQRR